MAKKRVSKDVPIILYIDDREKKPWKMTLPSKIVRLKVGDITVKGYSHIIIIERKGSIEDLCLSLGKHRNRFFSRMQEMVSLTKYPLLILEMDFRDLVVGSKYSHVHPASLIGSLFALISLGVIPIFLGKARFMYRGYIEKFIVKVVRREIEGKEKEGLERILCMLR